MPSDEERKILRMVEDGKISAEEAMKLIKALEEPSLEIEVVNADATWPSKKSEANEFEEIARKARGLWQIPLWIGITITVLCSYWLYWLVSNSNFGFWLFCAAMLFLSGVLLLAAFSRSWNSRWLYLRVDQPYHEWPRNIVLGFPLPLGVASWILNNFGNNIEGLNQDAADQILQVLSQGLTSKAPLIVNVNGGKDDKCVQVYIG